MTEKGTMSISELVEQTHGLPASSRTPEEVDEDYRNELEFTRSLGRSLVRRDPKRFESEIVVDILDDLGEVFAKQTKSVGEIATKPVKSIFDTTSS
jgi:hypothetical protein